MSDRNKARAAMHARTVARKLAMQAIYQALLNDQPWQDLHTQFVAGEEMGRADREHFRDLLEHSLAQRKELEAQIALCTDREVALLDPIEHAIVLLGAYELRSRLDVPFRVVISEAVDLARKFGAADGHKFVNAVLDCLAARLRVAERSSAPA